MKQRTIRTLQILFFFVMPFCAVAQEADYYVVRKNGVLHRVPKYIAHPVKSNNERYQSSRSLLLDLPLEPFVTTASWYGPGFHGRRMANGERFDQNNVVVAHRNWPLGSCVRITSLENGNSISAPVLDRGPHIRGRDIDLSKKTMEIIGGKRALKKGLKRVLVEPVSRLECLLQ